MSIFNDKALKSVAEAAAKVMQQEELKGNQHKIDANKNGKVDAHDFKLLRGKKNLKEDDTGYQDRYAVKNGKAVKHNPMRGERDEPHHVWADNADHAVRKHAAKNNAPMKEDVQQLDEIGNTPAGRKLLKKVDKRAFYMGGTKRGGKANMADAGEKTLQRTQARLNKEEVDYLQESFADAVARVKAANNGKLPSGNLPKLKVGGVQASDKPKVGGVQASDKPKAKKDNTGRDYFGHDSVRQQSGYRGPGQSVLQTGADAIAKGAKAVGKAVKKSGIGKSVVGGIKAVKSAVKKTFSREEVEFIFNNFMLEDIQYFMVSEEYEMLDESSREMFEYFFEEQLNESMSQLDELSKDTLNKYVKKTTDQYFSNLPTKPDTPQRKKGYERALDRLHLPNTVPGYKKEEVELDEAHGSFPTVADAKKRMDAGKTATGSVTKTKTGLVHKRDYKDEEESEDTQKKAKGYGARQNYKRSTRVNEQLSFTEMLELYNEHGLKVLAPIETEEMDIDGTTIQVIDGDKINGYVETTVEEVTNDEFTKEFKDQQASFEGKKKQPKVATGKTTGVKEMPEEYELDERSLTSDEKSDMEKNVKGMKKKLSSFKDRYGDDAKSVMYATATKMAKEDIDSDETIDELYNPVTVKKGVRRSVDSGGKVSYSGGVRVKGSGASSAGKVIGHDIDVQKRKESMFKQKHPVLSKIKSAGQTVSKAIDKVASIKIGNKNRAGG